MTEGVVRYMKSLLGRYRGVIPKELTTYFILDALLSSIFWVVQAPYLKCLGFTALEYGVLGSVFSASVVISTLLAGWLVDRLRAKYLMITSLVLRSISYIMYLPGIKLLIYLATAINGLSSSLATVPTDVLISRLVNIRKLEYGYSLTYALFLIGNSLGAYLGWVPELVSKYSLINIVSSYRYVITFSAITLPLTSLLLIRVKEPLPKRSLGSSDSVAKKVVLPRNVVSVVIKLCIAEALIGLGASISIRNISYYFILKYGVESGELGTVFGAESLLMAALMIYLPKVSERVGNPLRTYALVSMLSVPLLVSITFINSYVVASLLYICRSALMNAASPLFVAFEMRVIPPEHRGKASSIIRLADRSVAIVGRGLGGYLMSIDLELPLRITALLYAISLTYLLTSFRSSDLRSSN